MEMIKKFFSSVTNVLLFLLGIAGLFIYFLTGKNNLLSSLLKLQKTLVKDESLKDDQEEVKAELKKEVDKSSQIQDNMDKAKQDASKQDPEEFWKKH